MDFNDYKDKNGFIRLKDIPMVQKFIDTIVRLSMSAPCKYIGNSTEISERWKKYPWKTDDDGFADCEREVFTRRIMRKFIKGSRWIVWSSFAGKPNTLCREDDEPISRNNVMAFIGRISYHNKPYGQYGYLKLMNYNVCGDSAFNEIIDVNKLTDIVFRFCTDEEAKCIQGIFDSVSIDPVPCYEAMWIKKEYKDDYDAYLKDCEKYGYTPMEKILIDNLVGEVAVDKNCLLLSNVQHPDYNYVNL